MIDMPIGYPWRAR